MLLANFNGKEHLRHRAVSLRQHGFLVMIYSSKCSLCSTVSEHISCILIIFSSRWPEVKRSAKLFIVSNFGPYWISVLFNPWNQVWYYNAHMFSKEYIIGKFLVRFGVHRTYAKSGVQSQSWPSFSTDRQHFTRSRKITSLGSPTVLIHFFLFLFLFLLLLRLLLLHGRKSHLHLSHLPSLILQWQNLWEHSGL